MAKTPEKDENVAPGNMGDGAAPEKTEEVGRVIRVTATKMGYIDHVRRRAGDVFDVEEKNFSADWMTVVDGSTPPKTTTAKASLQAIHDEALADKLASRASGGGSGRSTGDRDVTS